MAPPIFPRVQAAAIDGRLHNIYHRQVELEKLCKALNENVHEITAAIASDFGHSPAEIAVEFHQTLAAIRRDYAELEPLKALEEEYLIANGKNAEKLRVPVGIVYVEPTTRHTLLYSTIAPLSKAFAAGNCVVVLLENNLRAVSSLLRRILTAALDADTFAVAPSPVTDKQFLDKAISVIQNGITGQPTNFQLASSQGPVVAIIDRTADIECAARELVAARFAFGGHSPFAPDIVLVNEFRKPDLLQAVVNESIRLGSGVNSSKAKTPTTSKITEQINNLSKSDSNLRTIFQDSNLAILDLTSRTAVLATNKIEEAVLVVHGIKSLDDGIDLINSQTSGMSCAAAYHFSNPATGKYLSQFVAADVTFINHIPRELLLGPTAPIGKPLVDLSDRFPADFFTITRPAFIAAPSSKTSASSPLLVTALSSANNATAQRLLIEASAPLAEKKRNPGGGVGFFEQGFLLSAGIILSSAVLGSIVGVVWFWRRTGRVG